MVWNRCICWSATYEVGVICLGLSEHFTLSHKSPYEVRQSWLAVHRSALEIYYVTSVNSQSDQNRLVHQTNIIVEFASKNDAKCIYITANSQNYQNRLVQLINRYYSWFCIEKRAQDIYNTSLQCNSYWDKPKMM